MSAQKFKRDRPTIGILTGRSILEGTPGDYYRELILRGIQSAAQIRRCHTVLAWGIRSDIEVFQIYPTWPIVSPESDFVPVGPWNMDGLIVFTPLGNEDRSLYLQKLIATGYPVLFIATGEQGPTISVDNGLGIRQAMTHLVEHGHRRIAFLAGIPADTGDTETRLQVYLEALVDHNLKADPRLVVWGWHNFSEGYKVTQTLLASGVKFTAMMASNDNSAVGAMQAIREAGMRIPADIAIIGFDDQPVAMAQVPLLSSVHVPLTVIGEQALVSMLDHLMQQAPLQSVQIPTRLVRRQSCGCMSEVIAAAMSKDPKTLPGSLLKDRKRANLQEQKELLTYEMLSVLPSALRFPGGDEIYESCISLVEAFYTGLQEMNPIHFQTVLIDCIYELEMADRSIEPWQEMISVLRREMRLLPLDWKSDETVRLADDLLHQARAVIGESAQRQDQRHEYRRSLKARNLNKLTASLSAALSERQAVKFMNEHLENVDIGHARVMFFEAEGDDPVAWSLVLNADADLPPQRFPSRQFPPPGLYPADELLNVILLPLAFQNEVFGYAALEASDLVACAVIATQLAATIKVARLHTQVVELSLTDPLTGLHNRRSFELFLKNEVSRGLRFSRSLAVILVDVDFFKEYNDTYGHLAGDVVLQQVAKCFSDARRSADIVARIGGDEFVIILPETDIPGALKVSRRIRAAVADLPGLERPISVSMGLTALGSAGTDAEALIKQADIAMYESKRAGRNRISVYSVDRVVDENEYPSPA